jgi:CubicO group peptidase (beta-lactamase class C family)
MHRFCLLALLSASALAAEPAQGNPAARLQGLWGAWHRFGPQARGVLIVDGRSREWVAHIAGFDVPVRRSGASVSFALPNGLGEFRGEAVGRDSIRGLWFQPPAVIAGSFANAVLGNSFACAVSLSSVSENVWKGPVSPLRDELTFYLMVEAATDGRVTAFIRNPETNFAAARRFSVDLNGRLIALTDSRSAGWNLQGTYDDAADRLTLDMPLQVKGKNTFVAFDFSRENRDEAVGFYPRRRPADEYDYRTPIRTGDGWETSSLEDEGMRTEPVTEAIRGIISGDPASAGASRIQGLLVARHGRLVVEEYFYGFDQGRLHDLRSVGNSITSTLVGIAIDHGAPFGLGSPVYSLFPEYKPVANPDPRKDRVTVRDLLTMTSGLAGNDLDPSTPGNELRMFFGDFRGGDYYKTALDLPMASDPGGTRAVKFTAGMNLAGGIVRNTTGMPLMDFFGRYFAKPLKIEKYFLNLTPPGDMYGGGGLYLLPRDALKLGEVYRAGGTWGGQRIVSREWVSLSTRRYSEYGPDHGYGLAWHLFQLPAGGRTHFEFEAEGNGGQVVSVIPDLDLVVLFTTGNYDEDETVPERAILRSIMESVR